MKKQMRAFLVLSLMAGMHAQAFAIGGGNYSSELISVRALAQGDTGAAGVYEDPITAYTNPAGLTSIPGTKLTVGGTYLNFRLSETNPATGSEASAHTTSVFIPAMGISTRLMDDKLGVGASFTSPYGTESHWDPASPMRYFATDSKLHLVVFSPAIAYKVSDQFSAGFGIDYANVFDGVLGKQINNALGGGTGDASSRLNASGDGWGYHLGLQYKPNEHHAVGLAYHSKIKLALIGNAQLTNLNGGFASPAIFGGPSFSTNITTALYLPENFQLGYAYMPNDKWQFEIDGGWYMWHPASSLGIVFNNTNLTPTAAQILNTNNPQQFNTRNTINFGAGANYKQNDKLQWRGGMWYQAASAAESGFDPAIPDLPRYSLTAGGSYAFTPTIGMDWAYEVQWLHTRYISNTTNGGGVPLNASFTAFGQELSAALTVKLPGWGGSK